MQTPHIRTELPGPKARALIARDAAVISPSYPREYPFAMSHGRGTEVWDVDGNRFLDFAAGIAVCATGHSHPQVVAAVKDAAEQFLHISSDYWHERMVRLGERLGEVAPFGEAGDDLHLPVRHRGGGGRAQARALRQRAAALPRLHRRIPRPHDGLAQLHLEQVHPAEGLLPDHAGRHPRAVPEPVAPALRRRRPGPRGARLHRARAVPGHRCPRAKSRRCWSSRSRARAVTWCRPRASSPACARCATGTGSC